MKAVILAGGLGSRIADETYMKPKPMLEIGGKPILWHLLKNYSKHGVNDFVICCGYKGYVIKEYFANYFLHMSDVTFDMENNAVEVHQQNVEPWRVTLVDTGEHTSTGGRLKRVAEYVRSEKNFCFSYGDVIADIDVAKLLQFHLGHKKLATIVAVQPPGRHGALVIEPGAAVTGLLDRTPGDAAWINGGTFVLAAESLDYIQGDDSVWETDVLSAIARDGGLRSYEHTGFWTPIDTLRDKVQLDELWATGAAPWKTWDA